MLDVLSSPWIQLAIAIAVIVGEGTLTFRILRDARRRGARNRSVLPSVVGVFAGTAIGLSALLTVGRRAETPAGFLPLAIGNGHAVVELNPRYVSADDNVIVEVQIYADRPSGKPCPLVPSDYTIALSAPSFDLPTRPFFEQMECTGVWSWIAAPKHVGSLELEAEVTYAPHGKAPVRELFRRLVTVSRTFYWWDAGSVILSFAGTLLGLVGGVFAGAGAQWMLRERAKTVE